MKTSVILSALLLVAPFARASACTLQTIAELPVTMTDGQPMAHGRLNGRPADLLISTGADYSLIKPSAATRLRLQRTTPPTTDAIADRDYAEAETVQLGAGVYPQMGFIVSPGLVPGKADGVIGRNVLDIADTEYDLGAGKVRLIRSRGCVGREMAYWDKDQPFSVLTMTHNTDVRPGDLASVWVNGVRLTALLDPGAGPTAITRDGARRAGLAPADEPTIAVPEVRFDQERITRTRLRLTDHPGADYDMVLGSDFFASHHVYIARTQQRVYFTYNGGPVFAH